MQLDESPSVVLRKSALGDRTKVQDAVRESILTDSTSGIVKGDNDSTSIGSSTPFSSPELDISAKELLSPKVNKDRKSVQYEEDFDGINNDLEKKSGKNHVDKTEIVDDEIARIENEKLIGANDVTKVSIPDGGWGWIVVLSSFVISMIADGISFSFGLLYIEFLDEFGASKSTTAWIGSLFIAVPLLAGPVMSALVDRYGCRSMTILGGIISSLGFVLASVSTTLETMMLTFGVIAGLGLGLVYVTAVVSIAYWFEKKRNLAVGLGACGTGVGTFVYAPMTQYFIDEYGWRGTILLLSGTLLNLCVCGCVMRDPEWWILEQKRQKEEEKSTKDDVKSKYSSSYSVANGNNPNDFEIQTKGKNMKRMINRGVSPEKVIKDEVASIRRLENVISSQSNDRKSSSLLNLPTYLTYNDKKSSTFVECLLNKWNNKSAVKFPTKNEALEENEENHLNSNSPKEILNNGKMQRTCSEQINRNNEEIESYKRRHPKLGQIRKSLSETKENRPLLKQDSKESKREWLKKQLSVNHHYLRDLKMPINSLSHRNAMLNIKKYKLKASSCPDIFKNSMITVNEQEEKWYDDCVSCLGDMFNLSLFKKITFDLLCIGTIVIFVWFIVPYFYLAEHMIQNGYSEDDGAFMLSLIGVTNTIGMVTLGWIGDFPNVAIGNLYALCLILCGAAVAAIPLAPSYWILASICAAFGLLFAASFTFTPSLLVKLVSLDDFTSAYGLVLLAQGIGHLIGPPLSETSWSIRKYQQIRNKQRLLNGKDVTFHHGDA
ncbi:Monocarboxylate transporter 14 [Danaus plexippus plexippus]|uniref:Monocarboxylate transporter 14 n=1 Tax=Danaus plexippus plexippus TaxID=278856 RepID=A0A212EL79_DANPL|nr:Monocarboxylate transporter 14 [Danaus plexippus plexippus]